MTCIMDEDKLQEIEIALAHQDQQIQELNNVMTDQWKQIEALRVRLDRALSKIDCLEGGGDGEIAAFSAAQEKPPHF